jgi:hypothetical protein
VEYRMRIYDIDIWLANLGFGSYAVIAYVVKNVSDHTSDVMGVMISIATVLGGLALAWYNIEKAWSERQRRKREKSESDK